MDHRHDYSASGGCLGPSLHDELMQDLHVTGTYELAEDVGIVQNGSIPSVLSHERNMWANTSIRDNHGEPSGPPLRFERNENAGSNGADDFQQGAALMAEAAKAAVNALDAAEQSMHRGLAGAQSQDGSPSSQGGDLGDDGDDMNVTTPPRSRKKRTTRVATSAEKAPGGRNNGKGLRHFSHKVCEKVESKGSTTYNEVADELVREFSAQASLQAAQGIVPGGRSGAAQYDEKNIRRRVYDALNVLMAMDIIKKQKKEISWIGLAQGPMSPMASNLRNQHARLTAEIKKQRQQIQELVKHQTLIRNLILRNKDTPMTELLRQSSERGAPRIPLQLPFILLQTHADATVEIQIAEDERQARFDFKGSLFRIHGYEEVLEQMGLDQPQGETPQGPSAGLPESKASQGTNTPALPLAQSGVNGVSSSNHAAAPAASQGPLMPASENELDSSSNWASFFQQPQLPNLLADASPVKPIAQAPFRLMPGVSPQQQLPHAHLQHHLPYQSQQPVPSRLGRGQHSSPGMPPALNFLHQQQPMGQPAPSPFILSELQQSHLHSLPPRFHPGSPYDRVMHPPPTGFKTEPMSAYVGNMHAS